MSTTVFCLKLKKHAPGMTTAPYPGALGEKILAHICAEAWQQWLKHQTLLINEHRLSLSDPAARTFLNTELEKFLFGSGSNAPAGFIPIQNDNSSSNF